MHFIDRLLGKEDEFYNAVWYGRIEIVESFLKKKKDWVHRRDFAGRTALHIAALRGYLEIVKLLIAYGSDVNARIEDTMTTPLHMAVEGPTRLSLEPWESWELRYNNKMELIRLLVIRGANVNAKNNLNMTPLDVAWDRQLYWGDRWFDATQQVFDKHGGGGKRGSEI